MTATYRQPTVEEAVAALMLPATREYRRRCISYWREHYGDAFADTIQAKVEQKFSKRKGAKAA